MHGLSHSVQGVQWPYFLVHLGFSQLVSSTVLWQHSGKQDLLQLIVTTDFTPNPQVTEQFVLNSVNRLLASSWSSSPTVNAFGIRSDLVNLDWVALNLVIDDF